MKSHTDNRFVLLCYADQFFQSRDAQIENHNDNRLSNVGKRQRGISVLQEAYVFEATVSHLKP